MESTNAPINEPEPAPPTRVRAPDASSEPRVTPVIPQGLGEKGLRDEDDPGIGSQSMPAVPPDLPHRPPPFSPWPERQRTVRIVVAIVIVTVLLVGAPIALCVGLVVTCQSMLQFH
jgi:hypothetical protein